MVAVVLHIQIVNVVDLLDEDVTDGVLNVECFGPGTRKGINGLGQASRVLVAKIERGLDDDAEDPILDGMPLHVVL